MLIRVIRAARRIITPQQNGQVADPFFGINAGEGTIMGPPNRIEGAQYIQIGSDCHIGAHWWLGAYDSYPFSNQSFSPQIIIGNRVFIGDRAIITSINKVIIEDGVEISHDVFISDHVHSNTPEENVPLTRRRLVSRGYVKIGAFTGVGIRSVISQGVTLGKYCFVTPNSVVTRSFPDYSMVRGNPAQLIKIFCKEKNKWTDPSDELKQRYRSL